MKGLYEPIHGTAPDIAGQQKANPVSCIMSLAMSLEYSLGRADLARKIDAAVSAALASGVRTADIAESGQAVVSTTAMGDAIVEALALGPKANRGLPSQPVPTGADCIRQVGGFCVDEDRARSEAIRWRSRRRRVGSPYGSCVLSPPARNSSGTLREAVNSDRPQINLRVSSGRQSTGLPLWPFWLLFTKS